MSVYLGYNKLGFLKLPFVLILVALYLGSIIAAGQYLAPAAILFLPALLFLSPFHLLLLLFVVFQIDPLLLPVLRIGPLGLRPNDLVVSMIMIKLFLDLVLNEGNFYLKNWRIPKQIELSIILFIVLCMVTQIKLLILGTVSEILPSMVTFTRFLTNILLIFIVPASIKKESQLKAFIIFILLFIIIQSCLAVFQHFSGRDIFGTIKEGAFHQGEVAGLLYEPGSFGIYVLLGFCLFLGIFIYRLFPSILTLLSLLLFLIAILFSQSRTTWLAFLAIVPLIALEFNVRGKAFMFIGLLLVIIIAGFLFFDIAKERVTKQAEQWSQGHEESNSYAMRWKSMKLGITTGIEANYLLGSGWETFHTTGKHLGLSMGMKVFGIAKEAHSAYIQIFTDMGIFVLIAFFAILYNSLNLARRLYKGAANVLWKATAFGIFLWLFSLLFWFISGMLTAGSTPSNLLWLNLGILICIHKLQFQEKKFPTMLRINY